MDDVIVLYLEVYEFQPYRISSKGRCFQTLIVFLIYKYKIAALLPTPFRIKSILERNSRHSRKRELRIGLLKQQIELKRRGLQRKLLPRPRPTRCCAQPMMRPIQPHYNLILLLLLQLIRMRTLVEILCSVVQSRKATFVLISKTGLQFSTPSDPGKTPSVRPCGCLILRKLVVGEEGVDGSLPGAEALRELLVAVGFAGPTSEPLHFADGLVKTHCQADSS